MPKIQYKVVGANQADLRAKAQQIATTFFGTFNGVTLDVDDQMVGVEEADASGIPTKWSISVIATK